MNDEVQSIPIDDMLREAAEKTSILGFKATWDWHPILAWDGSVCHVQLSYQCIDPTGVLFERGSAGVPENELLIRAKLDEGVEFLVENIKTYMHELETA